jgi:hypothetical protein
MFKMWRAVMLRPRLYTMGGGLMRRSLRLIDRLGLGGSVVDPMRTWRRGRAVVPMPKESFRARWKREEGQ